MSLVMSYWVFVVKFVYPFGMSCCGNFVIDSVGYLMISLSDVSCLLGGACCSLTGVTHEFLHV